MAVDGSLRITWFGQAMFRVSGGGATVVLDPTPPETGYRYDPVSADVVLRSHDHYDHDYLRGVRGEPQVIRDSGAFEVRGLEVRGTDSFHDAKQGAERGRNVVFTWSQAGYRLGHLGDLGHMPDDDLAEALSRLDILMLPVGGVFTIDAAQAVDLVERLAPRVALPMHYGTPDCNIPVEPVDGFARLFKGAVREIAERPLVVTTGSLPAGPEVWVLPYK